MELSEIQDKSHYIAITGIVIKRDNNMNRYLICKRNPLDKNFANKWCVPGGRIKKEDFINTPKDTRDHWLNIFEKILKKEIFEETQLKTKNEGYVSSLVFVRPNGFSTIIVSMYAEYSSGEVELNVNDDAANADEFLIDHAWVTLEEAKEYDLIENIYEQLAMVERKYTDF